MTDTAAIIGCGRIGADCGDQGSGSSRLGCHAAAYAASPRVRLVAACDPDPVRLRRAGDRWKISRLYSDHRELLANERIDFLSVCTPPHARGAVLADVLTQGRVRALLVEKPVAPSLEEADALIARARGSRVVVAVNYVRRFCPAYRRVAVALRQGALGRIQIVRGVYTKGVLNNGSHLLDLLRFFFGEPSAFEALSASGDDEPDPTVGFRAMFPAGFDAWVAGLDHAACSIFELDVIGASGRVAFSDLGHRMESWRVEDTVAAHGFRQLSREPEIEETGLGQAIGAAVDNLIESIETGAAPACTLDDARAALALSLRVRAAAASLRPARLPI